MTFEEADVLIDDFVGRYKIVDSKKVEFTVFPINRLPCSSGRLKYAHFIYAEYIIKGDGLTKKMGDLLIKSYAYIARFIDKDNKKIEEINKENLIHLKNLNKGKIYSSPILNEINLRILEYSIEFNNFLAECQSKYAKNKQ